MNVTTNSLLDLLTPDNVLKMKVGLQECSKTVLKRFGDKIHCVLYWQHTVPEDLLAELLQGAKDRGIPTIPINSRLFIPTLLKNSKIKHTCCAVITECKQILEKELQKLTIL